MKVYDNFINVIFQQHIIFYITYTNVTNKIIFSYRIKDVKWHIKDGTLHHILPIYNSGVEVTSYDSKTGDKLKTRRVSAPFITQETE